MVRMPEKLLDESANTAFATSNAGDAVRGISISAVHIVRPGASGPLSDIPAGHRRSVVRGGVEPPTFRFSGVADTQFTTHLPWPEGVRRALTAGVGCRRCRQRCRHGP